MSLPIAAVTVHPDGALVRRSGRVAVVEGSVIVRALPLLLDPGSVRVEIGGAQPSDVRIELDLRDEDRGPSPPELDAVTDAATGLALLDAELAGLHYERGVLSLLAPEYDPEDHERALPDPARMAAFATADGAIDAAVAAIDTRLLRLDGERRRRFEAYQILRYRLDQASSESWWRRWAPTRRVIASIAGDGERDVTVSYRIPGARWSPAYVLDAEAGLRRGRFSMRAVVTQATGEDWTGVTLALSTAPATRLVDLPELPALRLGARQPSPPVAWRALPADLEDLFPVDLPPWPEPAAAAEPAPEDLDSWAGADPPSESFDIDDTEELLSGEELNALDLADDESATHTRAMPQSMPAPMPGAAKSMPARRSAGLFSRAAAAPAPPSPAGGAARKKNARRAEPESEEGRVDVASDLLDYGRMRLAPWHAPARKRGRLALVDDDGLIAEAGLPAAAAQQLRSALETRRHEASATARQALPPHHVVPAPLGGTDARFDAEGTVDLPSDGRGHSVSIRTWPVALEVMYRAVPRSDPRAFRRVTARLDHEGALLPGPVDVYVDGRLELTSPWSGTPGRGRLQLDLGAEDRLRLVRNVRYQEQSAGIFGNHRSLETTIQVDVASSLPRPVQVEILERIPVPRVAKDATVTVLEASPVASDFGGEVEGAILKGGKRQLLDVAPGGEARAVLKYSVTLGGKDELVGGDRRG